MTTGFNTTVSITAGALYDSGPSAPGRPADDEKVAAKLREKLIEYVNGLNDAANGGGLIENIKEQTRREGYPVWAQPTMARRKKGETVSAKTIVVVSRAVPPPPPPADESVITEEQGIIAVVVALVCIILVLILLVCKEISLSL